MACITLLGGIPGVGKSEFFRFLIQDKKSLFNPIETVDNDHNKKTIYPRIHFLIFDNICPREEQLEMVKKWKSFRDYRTYYLMAAERYICETCKIECQMQGPLVQKSLELLETLKKLNEARFQVPYRKEENFLFLVEDNFYYWSMRYDWFQIAKREGLGFCQLYLTCPLEVAVERNETRFFSIPKEVIRTMHIRQEIPDPVKHKFEKFSLILDNSEELTREKICPAIKLIETALENPIETILNEKKLEAQIIVSKNVVHQADKILRKFAGQLIKESKENSPYESTSLIEIILFCRHELLIDIKQRNVRLPEHITCAITSSGINAGNVVSEFEEVLKNLLKEKCACYTNDFSDEKTISLFK